jgi:hypothetical protein
MSGEVAGATSPRSVIVMFDTSCPAAWLRLLTPGLASSAFHRVRTVLLVGLLAVVLVTSAIELNVVTAAVLPLNEIDPATIAHCTVGHCSSEPGHRKLLERLGKPPLLDLDMRLGEGSGAMAAVPLIAMACAGITDVPTFAEWFGE